MDADLGGCDLRAKMSPRPKLLVFLAVTQWLVAAFCAAGLLALMVAMRQADQSDEYQGLMIGAGACLLFAFVALAAGVGIWKLRAWGQRTALFSLAVWVAMLGYGWYDEGDWEHEVLPVLIPFAGLLCLHLLPATRRAFRSTRVQSPPPSI